MNNNSKDKQIKSLKKELKEVIGKLALARGMLYEFSFLRSKISFIDEFDEWDLLKAIIDITAGDTKTLTHKEVQQGFRTINNRIHKKLEELEKKEKKK